MLINPGFDFALKYIIAHCVQSSLQLRIPQMLNFLATFSIKKYIWVEKCNLVLNFFVVEFSNFDIANFLNFWQRYHMDSIIFYQNSGYFYNVKDMPSDYIKTTK